MTAQGERSERLYKYAPIGYKLTIGYLNKDKIEVERTRWLGAMILRRSVNIVELDRLHHIPSEVIVSASKDFITLLEDAEQRAAANDWFRLGKLPNEPHTPLDDL